MQSKQRQINWLVVDLAVSLGFILISSWLLEFLKPGLISNSVDLNALLIIWLISLLTALVVDTSGYKAPFLMRSAYLFWCLLALLIFA